MNRMHIKTSLSLATLTFISALSGASQAQTVDLLTTPPNLTTTVAPNIVVTFDDSGSMHSTAMPDNLTSSGSDRRGQIYYYSSRTNSIYFDPTRDYPPPLRADGTSFPNADYNNAWRDGLCANAPGSYCFTSPNRKNLATHFYQHFGKLTNSGDTPNHNVGMDIPVGVRGGSSGKFNGGFYYNCPTPNSNTGCTAVYVNDQSAAVKQKFANWYSYYRTRNLLSRTAMTRAFGSISGDVRTAWQTINSDYWGTTPALRGRAIQNMQGAWRNDFYNWLYDLRTAGGTPLRRATIEAGRFYERALTADNMNPYWDDETNQSLSCRKNFHMLFTDGYWNGAATVPAGYFNGQSNRLLPDGRSLNVSDPESRAIWNVSGAPFNDSLANIAFHYWAKDLQPGLANNVSPYLPDKNTGVTNTIPYNPGAAAPANNPLNNKEIYWNPANNPATWQNVSQFVVSLGIAGTLNYPGDMLNLRTGVKSWPRPVSNGSAAMDDAWHAAVNSRGAYFSASNPAELVQHLSDVLASILAQSASSTPASISLPIMTGGNSGYQGGYDSSDWAGKLQRRVLELTGNFGDADWDAGCLLTGGQCADPAATGLTPRDPNDRVIFTSNGAGSGIPFRWGSLDTVQQTALSPNGSARVSHLRGDRSYETAPATPLLRSRSSLLGAIVNGEPLYVSSPIGGFYDIFPAGSPETTAAAANQDHSYAGYQNAQRSRAPTIYAGSNNGMLHAIDAVTGKELWAYVPNVLISNGRLRAGTERTSDLVPGVDSPARQADVFIGNHSGTGKKWRTVLLGSLRLGGRGIYALDITNPNPGSESAVTGSDKVALWEFTSGTTPSTPTDAPCSPGATSCASLGYTYDSINVMRVRYQNKWVAVVSSGYFPRDAAVAANASDSTEAAASRTSLLVIDMETGKLIREIRTDAAPQARPAGFRTFGLSTPMVYDEGADQLDDLVYAGDLAGNLWRFDLSDESDPNNWTVDLMFTSYGAGGAAAAGEQPIAYNPSALRDPTTRRPILVVGTGKYLGSEDRTQSIPRQAWYGIRDYGANSPNYPIRVNQLITQTVTQDASSTREISSYTAPAGTVTGAPNMLMKDGTQIPAHGWRIPLNISAEPGERAQRRAFPLVSSNVAVLYGLIPISNDPCNPGIRYSVMAVDAATGESPAENGQVGGAFQSPAPPADPAIRRGGGTVAGDSGSGTPGSPPPATIIIPGVPDVVSDAIQEAAIVPPWHRGAWRDLMLD